MLYYQCGMSFNYCVVYVVCYSMAYCMCWMYDVTLFLACNCFFLNILLRLSYFIYVLCVIAALHVFKCLKTIITSISCCVLLPCVPCMVLLLHYSFNILLFPVALKDLAQS